MTKKKPVFRASRGAYFGDAQAQVYGEFLTNLSERKGRPITTQEILEAARSEDSPIHDYFEWDDTVAAAAWRRSQARNLINRIEIVVVSNDEEHVTKAFHNVVIESEDDGGEHVYVTAEVVAHDKHFRDLVIANALQEVKRWQAKYSEYQELSHIFGAIERTQKNLQFYPPAIKKP